MTTEWTDAQEKRFAGEDELVDADALKNPIQRQRIDVAVKFIGGPNLKVLDAACSGGGISELIHANGNDCWGIDLPGVVHRVPESRLSWFKVVGGDLNKRPWFDHKFTDTTTDNFSEFFDVVFSGEYVEHLLDIAPFFEEAHRVLKPGGRLVLTTPNATRALNRIAMLLGVVSPWTESERIPHHSKFWTRNDLAKALVKYAFKPTRWGYGRSQAEGDSSIFSGKTAKSIGFDAGWLDYFTPSLRGELMRYFSRLPPEEIHSFIIVEAARV